MKTRRARKPFSDTEQWTKTIEKIPFVHLLGMKVVSFEENGLVMTMRIGPKHLNVMGGVHGGALVSVIDTVVYFAIRRYIPNGKVLSTSEIKVNFFRPVSVGKIETHARILHLGKHTAVGEAEITDSEGRLVAKGTVGHLIAPGNKRQEE